VKSLTELCDNYRARVLADNPGAPAALVADVVNRYRTKTEKRALTVIRHGRLASPSKRNRAFLARIANLMATVKRMRAELDCVTPQIIEASPGLLFSIPLAMPPGCAIELVLQARREHADDVRGFLVRSGLKPVPVFRP
jgi:hypothetical protein